MPFYHKLDDTQIHTEYAALISKVMRNGNGRIKLPINEPTKGAKKFQIEEYLHFYEVSAVQHLAVATDDIIKTVSELKERGIEFLPPPQSYYDDIPRRLGDHMKMMKEDLNELRDLSIMIAVDGYLLQILEDRPTLFF